MRSSLRFAGAAAVLAVLASAGLARSVSTTRPTTQPTPAVFDPSKYMRVSEVRPGMKGFGRSVFLGTTIQPFDVEVVSVLHNFNPKGDVILIRCHGQGLEHSEAIAGMSGSPIYLYDDTGKARMVGAFAYGWPLQKDPLAGVQPIEYMLKLPVGIAPASTQPTQPTQSTQPSEARVSAIDTTWKLSDCVMLPGMAHAPARYPLGAWNQFVPNPSMLSSGTDMGLQPLATPLMVSGLSPKLLAEIDPVFRAAGLTPMQGGGGASSIDRHIKVEPGSVLGCPLLRGDVDMSAIGTCTERIGDHIYAFGHPFNNEGPTSLPMGGGDIQGVIANYMTSFKLGAVTAIDGTLTTDQSVGIAGVLGAGPPMMPIDLRVKYADGTIDQAYHFDAAIHPKFTPLLTAAAISSAVTGMRELPQDHTVDYDFTVDFSDGRTLHVVNSSADATPAELFFEVGAPMIAAGENPFRRVTAKKLTGTILVSDQSRKADILYAVVPKSRFRRGETVSAIVSCRPYRGAEFTLPVDIAIPKDLPDGTYHLTISDWQKYLQDEQVAEPFRFTAQNLDQVFDVIRDVTSLRHDTAYVRLIRQADGVAVGHVAMPKLPSSRREVMIGSGRSDVSEYTSSAVTTFKTDYVLSGSAEFDITVDENTGTDVAAARANRTNAHAEPKPSDVVPHPQGGDGGGPPADAPAP